MSNTTANRNHRARVTATELAIRLESLLDTLRDAEDLAQDLRQSADSLRPNTLITSDALPVPPLSALDVAELAAGVAWAIRAARTEVEILLLGEAG